MKSLKKKALFILIMVSTFILSSCWNYIEIDERAIVAGLAIDKNKDNNKFALTVELIKPVGGETVTFESVVISSEGDTLFEAIRNCINKAGFKLYWSHTKIMIVSEDIANEGILQVLDLINRDAEIRKEVYVLLSRGTSAKEIFRKGMPTAHDTISYHLYDIINWGQDLPKFDAIKFWSVLDDLSSESISLTLPIVYLEKDEDKYIPVITGTAAFKEDKLVGYLDGDDTKILLLIKGKLKRGLIIVKNIANTNTNVSLELFKVKTKTKPVMIDGKLTMEIKVTMDVAIAELSNDKDYISKDSREILKKEAEALLKSHIEELIKKVQSNYNSDIFGFANIVERNMPKTWNELKPQWDEIFSQIESQASVDIKLSRSAITSKPLKKGM